MRFIFISLALALAACTTLPDHPEVALGRLDADGRGYLEAVGGLPAPAVEGLPAEPVQLHELPHSLSRLADHDYNRDGVVDMGEITQSWLLDLFQRRKGQIPALSTGGEVLTGLRLSPLESRRVRAALEETLEGRTAVAEAAKFFADLREYRRSIKTIVVFPVVR